MRYPKLASTFNGGLSRGFNFYLDRGVHLIDSPLRARVNAVGKMLKPRLKVVVG